MDFVSAILAPLRVRGRVFCRGTLTAPWGFEGGRAGPIFHIVVAGQGIVRAGHETRPVAAGDLILLIRGGEHVLACDEMATPVPVGDAIERQPGRQIGQLVLDGGGVPTTVICGTFDLADAANHPLLESLPDLLVVHCRLARWLDTTLAQLHDELSSDQPGCELIAGRLCEILLMQALRAHLEQAQHAGPGLPRALGDKRIGAAIALAHTQPGAGWRVSTLADRVGMSRSAFFAKFSALVGESPASYITRINMRRAQQMLTAADAPTVAHVAQSLGYTTESAFSRAYKRFHRVGPGQVRRAAREPT